MVYLKDMNLAVCTETFWEWLLAHFWPELGRIRLNNSQLGTGSFGVSKGQDPFPAGSLDENHLFQMVTEFTSMSSAKPHKDVMVRKEDLVPFCL